MRKIKGEPKTLFLKTLREELKISQTDAGSYFGLPGKYRRNSIGKWEKNEVIPKPQYQIKFPGYLWNILKLRENPILFKHIWQEIMVEIWGWDPIDDESAPEEFPKSLLTTKGERPPLVTFVNDANYIERKKYGKDILEYIKPNGGNKICVIHGMAGIGKTMLAAQIQQAARPFFPDDTHWIDIGSLESHTILTNIARSFNIDISEVADLNARKYFVWKILMQKNALLVFDDVQKPDQISSIMPVRTEKISVLITTQRKDLIYLDDAKWLALKPFQQQEAIRYFEKVLDEKRVREEIKELEEISEQLEYLPLALAISAGRMKKSPYLSAKKYLQLLDDERSKLDHLEYGDRSVRASFNISFNLLSDDLKDFFISLGAFGGIDFDEDAAAFVSEYNNNQAYYFLTNLYDHSLCLTTSNKRYRLHSLIREYAREKITSDKSYLNMSRYYKERLYEAGALIDGETEDLEIGIRMANIEWSNINFGREWALDNQENNIVASELLSEYAMFGRRFIELSQPINIQQIWHKEAINAAKRCRNLFDLAIHLKDLGNVYISENSCDNAIKVLKQSIFILAEIESYKYLVIATLDLGRAYRSKKDYEIALEIFELLRNFAEKASYKKLKLTVLGNMGVIYGGKKEFNKALEFLTESLSIAQNIKNQAGICDNLIELANLHYMMENLDEAKFLYTKSINCFKKLHKKSGEAFALTRIGIIHRELGNVRQALSFLEKSIIINDKLGSNIDRAMSLLEIANTYHASGEFKKSIDTCKRALDIKIETRIVDIHGYANKIIANCLFELGDHINAQEHLNLSKELAKKRSEIIYENSNLRDISWLKKLWMEKIDKANENLFLELDI